MLKLNDLEKSNLLDLIHDFYNEFYKKTSDKGEKYIVADKYGSSFKIINQNETQNYIDNHVIFKCYTKDNYPAIETYKPKNS